ncbi:unnamed protein product [Chilo suppressalis]|uniref:Band 7 domain-containing protein n=1 Tax=Chilo suppressalis TaxID=168631 RepID=A0ABN8BK18_CHISP|nr:unnamed protein product [Chilo suppressalis]
MQQNDYQDETESKENPKNINTKTDLERGYYPTSFIAPNYRQDQNNIEKALVLLSIILVILAFPASLLLLFVSVHQFERVVILRNGKIRKNRAYGPGLVTYLPCVDDVKSIDLRINCYCVPPQEALTKDSLTISVDAVVYYKVRDPMSAVMNVADYKTSTQLLAATTLRNAIGNKKLVELLIDKPAMNQQILEQMNKFTKRWGIQVLRVDIKDIRLPIQLQKAMAAEAESSRLANAKIIVAKAEIESIVSLQKASAILAENPFCMQLRYLQSLQMMSGDNSHTIVFPFPTELMKKLFK